MIIGAHSIIYSTNSDADRAFLRDILKLTNVDVGEGWLIFGLPPAEVAVHPSEKNDVHEFYLMCDDIQGFVDQMKTHGVACSELHHMGWGILTQLMLPGGGKLGVYQPRHARPKSMGAKATAAPRRKKAATKKSKAKKSAPKAKAKPRKKAGRR